MSLTKRLVKNSFAGVLSKISIVIFRLIQVPILLSALGKDDYGRWLILYSLPSWIMLANLGFGSVASNEIIIKKAEGDEEKSQLIYNLTFRLLGVILLLIVLIVSSTATFIDWTSFLKTNSERNNEIALSVIFFTFSTMISSFTELHYARIKAAQKSYLIPLLGSIRPWLELLTVLIVLQFSKRFDYLSFAILFTTCIHIVSTNIISFKLMPSVYFKGISYKFKDFNFLIKKGVAFQAFPLGNALLYQGNLLVIQIFLGPESVALFGTVRTLVRSVNQVIETINQITWPEISILFGEKNILKIAQLHRLSILTSFIAAVAFTSFLYITGQNIFNFWTKDNLILSNDLLLLFLIPIPFNALWVTSSVIHMASNKHEGLAIRYLAAMILAVMACCVFSYNFGIRGAAISTIVSDVVLIPYVFYNSLKILGETKKDFVGNFKREIYDIIYKNNVYWHSKK